MHSAELLQFLRSNRYAVEASVTPAGSPQAAIIGVAVTDAFEIVFDTMSGSRKAQNLRVNRRLALVAGSSNGDDERTAQVEGLTDEPAGAELDRLKAAY